MRCLIILCSFIISKAVIAQQDFYIFIQSDNRAPFYVRMGERTYSSSATGHIVLSGLADSSYQLNIGLPKSQSPELNFQVPINKKDQGFELKNTSAEGWSLYDWRQMKFIRPAKKGGADASADSQVRRDDSYARLMAGLVDDSAVLYTVVSRPATVQQSKPVAANNSEPAGGRDVAAKDQKPPVIAAVPIDTKSKEIAEPAVPSKTDSAKSLVTAAPVDTLNQVNSSDVVRSELAVSPTLVSESKVDGGTKMVFVDKNSGVNDTIELLIPDEPSSDGLATSTESSNEVTAIAKQEEPKPDSSKPTADSLSASEKADTVKSGSIVLTNSDCREYATDVDVDKLRVMMLKEDSGEERITVARKTFRTKCFTTKQIKALTELFVQDEQRYRFFDTAYPFVSDTSNFKSLVDLLSDPYYVNRFKAMIRG